MILQNYCIDIFYDRVRWCSIVWIIGFKQLEEALSRVSNVEAQKLASTSLCGDGLAEAGADSGAIPVRRCRSPG